MKIDKYWKTIVYYETTSITAVITATDEETAETLALNLLEQEWGSKVRFYEDLETIEISKEKAISRNWSGL